MKTNRWLTPSLLTLLLLSGGLARAEFSTGLVDFITKTDSRVLLDTGKFDPADAKAVWARFDEELLGAVNQPDAVLAEPALNQRFAWHGITVIEHDDEPIELGAIEMKFYKLGGDKNHPDWLVTYLNGMGVTPVTTFRVIRFAETRYQIAARFEDSGAVPNLERLQWAALQVQKLPGGPGALFATYHMPTPRGGRSNRAEINWQWVDGRLSAVEWYPEVDWHEAGGKLVEGRGQAIQLN